MCPRVSLHSICGTPSKVTKGLKFTEAQLELQPPQENSQVATLGSGLRVTRIVNRSSRLYKEFFKPNGVSQRLLNKISKSTSVRTFRIEYILGEQKSGWEEIILISCDNKCDQEELRDLLRSTGIVKGYAYRVELNRSQKASGKGSSTKLEMTEVHGFLSPVVSGIGLEVHCLQGELSHDTLGCGLGCIVVDEEGYTISTFTLGGLISVAGTIYGLTTAHSFFPETRNDGSIKRNSKSMGEHHFLYEKGDRLLYCCCLLQLCTD